MAKKAYAGQAFVVVDCMKRSASLEETILFQKKLLQLPLHPYNIMRAKDWLTTGQTGLPFFTLGQNDRWKILATYLSISPLAEDRVDVVRMLKEERDSYDRQSKGRALSYKPLYD